MRMRVLRTPPLPFPLKGLVQQTADPTSFCNIAAACISTTEDNSAPPRLFHVHRRLVFFRLVVVFLFLALRNELCHASLSPGSGFVDNACELNDH